MKGTRGRETCQQEGCATFAKAYGWCEKHWGRIRKHGDPDRAALTVEQRFWANVTKTDYCWNYAVLNPAGYGRLGVGYRKVQAHRFSYELHGGQIPEGLVIDHLCRNRACVNPAHLEPVTNVENVMRGVAPHALNALKTFCVNGHEYTPENTMVRKEGWRNCRECGRERVRQRKERLRNATV